VNPTPAKPHTPHPLEEALAPHLSRIGPGLAATAYQRGLAVTQKDGTTRPIPITGTAVVVPRSELKRRVRLSAALASAGVKMAHAITQGPARELLLGCMAPFERSVVEPVAPHALAFAITRTDFFVCGGRPRALELNATIPAMPGYSDIAAASFIEAVGQLAGLSPDAVARLVGQNGSNTIALFRSLRDLYARLRPDRPLRRMALLARRMDSQLTECRYLVERFGELGVETDLVHPDELEGDDAVRAHGKTYDLVYRHLFVRRLEENPSPWVVDFFRKTPDPRALLLNPPAAHVETKTNFALLSQAGAEPDLAASAQLTEEELEAIREAVPWTRPLRHAPGQSPDGEPLSDLAEYVIAHPDRFVLKRAWDYGGKAVFLGRAREAAWFEERVKATYGRPLAWKELVLRAAQDTLGGGFVAQEVVTPDVERHVLLEGDRQVPAELYVDFSAYASVGLDEQPAWGGVCRGSPSQIVNILGGGGVLPLLTTEVADALREGIRVRFGR
jgi:hypothetical protein